MVYVPAGEPTPEEIEALKAELKAKHYAEMRARRWPLSSQHEHARRRLPQVIPTHRARRGKSPGA